MPMPSMDSLLQLVGLAKRVLDALPKDARPQLPPDVQRALTQFYDLSDYHGIAPADAPHIPDDGKI